MAAGRVWELTSLDLAGADHVPDVWYHGELSVADSTEPQIHPR